MNCYTLTKTKRIGLFRIKIRVLAIYNLFIYNLYVLKNHPDRDVKHYPKYGPGWRLVNPSFFIEKELTTENISLLANKIIYNIGILKKHRDRDVKRYPNVRSWMETLKPIFFLKSVLTYKLLINKMNLLFCEKKVHNFANAIIKHYRKGDTTMILEVRVNNFKVFSNEVKLDLGADLRSKRLEENIYFGSNYTALKSLCIYGPNNVGKSCLINALKILQFILSGRPLEIYPDILGDHNECTMGVTFTSGNNVYSYDFSYDASINNGRQVGFTYESLKKITYDKQKRATKEILYEVDEKNGKFYFLGHDDLMESLRIFTHNFSLLFAVNPKYPDPRVAECQKVCKDFSDSLMIIENGDVSPNKTMKELKNKNSPNAKLILSLIKATDLDIEDYGYDPDVPLDYPKEKYEHTRFFGVNEENMNELRKIYSVKKNDDKKRRVPSLYIDSVGTRKVAALAGYVVDALTNDKILIIDELGNSLCNKTSKALISMFNSSMNHKGQLIFTTHDTALLDTTTLFRKEQIWFMQKEEGNIYLYSLNDFTAKDDGVRAKTNIEEKYNENYFGALPHIDYFDTLRQIRGEYDRRWQKTDIQTQEIN